MGIERRAQLLVELSQTGERRQQALEQAQAELDRIAELAGEAVGEGIAIAEIARLTGVSRPTIYELVYSVRREQARAKRRKA
jgi:DNA-binding IclR family transcriptional regulator